MASDRDTLAEPVRHQLSRAAERTLEKLYVEWGITPGLPTPAVAIHRFADWLAKEGWRPPARVIETAEELAELDLPPGTLIVDDWKTAHRRDSDGHWAALSARSAHAPARIVFPATVAWEPKAGEQ